ncbi:MAG: type I secretion protein [Rhodobacterales bacterium]|nr:MAG: type I secretion protein [Rhodobacterales bacterium]
MYGGADEDYFHLVNNVGNDTVVGGETGGDHDILAGTSLTGNATVDFTGNEAGTLTVGGDTVTFSEIEEVRTGSGNDVIDASATTDGVVLDGWTGADTFTGGSGDDTINLGSGPGTSFDGAADKVILLDGFGDDVVDRMESPIDNGDGTFTGIDTFDVTNLHNANGDPVTTNDVTITTVMIMGVAHPVLNFPNGESITLEHSEMTVADLENPAYLHALGIPLPNLDYIVEGTSGDDLIDVDYTGDPEGDRVDHNDNQFGNNDDHIQAGAGNDTVISGLGDDLVEGGTGNDTITTGDGADTVCGGDGNDVIDTSGSNPASDYGWPPYVPQDTDVNDDKDLVYGGAGNDEITTGDDADTIHGGSGDDLIDGGLDDDTITGGTGDDTIIGGHGSDEIDGGSGDDTIWGGMGSGSDPFNLPDDDNDTTGPHLDPVTNNGIDVIHGGAGNDTIFGQDDDDELYGDAGNDVIHGGVDDDAIFGGTGSDQLYGNDDDDTIHGGTGNDYIDGGADDDTLFGEGGRDTILAGDGTDTVDGGAGDDTIYGGGDNDVLSGGDDRDTFIIREEPGSDPENTTVHGGAGGHDWDTLNLSDLVGNGWNIVNHDKTVDSDGNGFDGQIELVNSTTGETANIDYTNIEEVIPCFTPGTLIATPRGEVPVEMLKAGDRVITRDNGIQEIRWAGAKSIDWRDMSADARLKPILIRKGALGNGLPERDMLVSPNHRVLVANERTELFFDEREVLVSAKHLVDGKNVVQVETRQVTYIHFMFDHHEVVLSDGAWTESFQPGDYSLKGVGDAQREELFSLFPELETAEGIEAYASARRVLKKHEARMLVEN